MEPKLAAFVLGLSSHVPPLYRRLAKGTGGTVSARYCYSVWLRHLCSAHENGFSTDPRIVAELGPGDSLGIGLAALLTGADYYYGFDVLPYAGRERNLAILEELVELFRARESIPDDTEFPEVKPRLDSYGFPDAFLTGARLAEALRTERVDAIRAALAGVGSDRSGVPSIAYQVPWDDPRVIREGSVDFAYSQAVLEHVSDLEHTYAALRRWLRPGGVMSHQVDFRSHGITRSWNGHWSVSPWSWKIIQGRRPFLLNRLPVSRHRAILDKLGFEVGCERRLTDRSGISRGQLARAFAWLSDEDLKTSGAFIQAVKPA
jgi:SAM-dependent methyltransferase